MVPALKVLLKSFKERFFDCKDPSPRRALIVSLLVPRLAIPDQVFKRKARIFNYIKAVLKSNSIHLPEEQLPKSQKNSQTSLLILTFAHTQPMSLQFDKSIDFFLHFRGNDPHVEDARTFGENVSFIHELRILA